MDANKNNFASRARVLAGEICQVADDLIALQAAYDHRGYGPGAGNPIIEGDLEAGSVSPDDLYALMIAAAQLKNYMEGSAVVTGDHRATFDKCRNDF